MKKQLCLIALMCLLVFEASAQRTISGKVTHEDNGDPLPGVTVIVKSQPTTGTTTNVNGEYTLQEIPADATTLVFSFVGMKTHEVTIQGRSSIDVELASSVQEMQEVVITALGISKEKKALGYTTQEVDGDEISEGGAPDIENGLSGKVAGVEVRQSSGMPGAPSQILIRGATSFSGSNQPLYVIDGMPVASEADYPSNVTGAAYSNRALDIDPSQIKSINVLKGQAAATLYGMRASNGVIIITTKKGSSARKGKPTVQLNSTYTMDRVSVLPEVQQTYAQGTSGDFKIANSYSWGPKISALSDVLTFGGNHYSGHAGEFFDPYKNQWTTPRAYNNPANFYDRPGKTFTNSINISNNLDFGSYSLGFSSTDQSGIVKNSGMQRYNAKAAGEFKLSDAWKMNFSSNFSKNEVDKIPSGNDSWLFTVYGAPSSFDLENTPYSQEGQLGSYRQISYRRGGVGCNPWWAIANNHYSEATQRFFGNASIEFKPFQWMSAKYQLGMDTYTTDNEVYVEVGEGDLPAASDYPTPNNRSYGYVEPTGGEIANYGITRNIVNSLFTLNMQHRFTNEFGGSLMLGNEFNDNQSEYYSASGEGFSTPGWNDLDNTNTQNSGYSRYHSRTVGFFGEASLDYKRMLFLTATGRYDIVSQMPSGNRGFFYPSVSLGFVFTELGLFDNQDFLTFGKLRGSYSEVGQPASTYRPEPIYVSGGGSSGFIWGLSYPFQGVTGYQESSYLYDPNLVPQNSSTFEVGIDLRFFNNRLGIDYSYFDQSNTDQIFGVPIAGSTGYSSYFTNAGEMISRGHEIMLSITPLKSRGFDWNMSVNFARTKNHVTSLAEGVESISLGGYTTPNIRASAGDTYPAIYGERFQRDDQGRILIDDDPNSETYGMPTVGEFGLIGEVTPDFTVGLNNTFTFFRRLTFSAHFHWKQGGDIYSGSNRLMDIYGSSARTEDRETSFVYDGYKSDGTRNDIQRGGAGDEMAHETLYRNSLGSIPEAYIYETSFIKLRSASLNYELPENLFSGFFFEKASVGVSFRNWLIWSSLPYFDPETSQGQGNMAGGMDYMSLPQTESYGFNVKITF
jgi:TonB-linked SusC/RagA family outer membrane protein